jgi:hypothetical protein
MSWKYAVGPHTLPARGANLRKTDVLVIVAAALDLMFGAYVVEFV